MIKPIVAQPSICSLHEPDRIVEQVYSPEIDAVGFVVMKRGDSKPELVIEVTTPAGTMVPVHNDIVRHRVVRFPTSPECHEGAPHPEEAVREHIRKYVCLPDEDLDVGVALVLASWQSHRFETAPYLHLMGAPGSGKSRLLRVLADLTNRGTLLGASSSHSSLFRIQDMFKGTLALDEADYRANSAAHEEVLRALREGFQEGTVFTRTEGGHENWEPRVFDVFGPKVISGLKPFPDLALESRCVPIVMRAAVDPTSYPDRLPADYETEATTLRNTLLGWKVMTYFDKMEVPHLPGLEGRVKQVYGPLLAVSSEQARARLLKKAKAAQADLRGERRDSQDGEVLAALVTLAETEHPSKIYLQKVANRVNDQVTSPEPVNAKDVARVCRMLGLEPVKDGKGRYVHFDPADHRAAMEQFGLGDEPGAAA
jgi:hypothetical protein